MKHCDVLCKPFLSLQNIEELKTRLARFQASENELVSNDRVGHESETVPPHTQAESETQATENNILSQTENGSSSQEGAKNSQNDSLNTEDQTPAQAESKELSSVDAVDNSCTTAEPDADDYSTDRTGTMSPKSFATFKGFLVHTPEMNLPWESMRSVRQCTCGVAFSYSVRKVRAEHSK